MRSGPESWSQYLGPIGSFSKKEAEDGIWVLDVLVFQSHLLGTPEEPTESEAFPLGPVFSSATSFQMTHLSLDCHFFYWLFK